MPFSKYSVRLRISTEDKSNTIKDIPRSCASKGPVAAEAAFGDTKYSIADKHQANYSIS